MEEATQPSVVFKLLTFVTRLNSCCLFLWPRWQLLNCRSTLSVFHSPLPWESMIHLSVISCQVPGEIACLVHVLCALNPPSFLYIFPSSGDVFGTLTALPLFWQHESVFTIPRMETSDVNTFVKWTDFSGGSRCKKMTIPIFFYALIICFSVGRPLRLPRGNGTVLIFLFFSRRGGELFSFGNDFAGPRGNSHGICSRFGQRNIALDQSFLSFWFSSATGKVKSSLPSAMIEEWKWAKSVPKNWIHLVVIFTNER